MAAEDLADYALNLAAYADTQSGKAKPKILYSCPGCGAQSSVRTCPKPITPRCR